LEEIEEEGFPRENLNVTLLNRATLTCVWYQLLEVRLFEASEHIRTERYPYRGGGGSIWDDIARTFIMDDQEVSFDYKTQIDNFLTGRDPDDQSQPELLDEFPRFRNYIYVGLGNLTGNNRTIGDPGKIMLDYRLIENFS
jgi:hypothetical protein